mmetsp:Transcript_64205/g.140735  ORF Transcript_64205/g.140735 Transcript_64205/m.140735 type:complete len:236 (-) Transcript_64205:910-1617(-)
MARFGIDPQALCADAHQALADHQENVRGGNEGPLVQLGSLGAIRCQGWLRSEEAQESRPSSFILQHPLSQIFPQRRRHGADLFVRGAHEGIDPAREDLANPFSPRCCPAGGSLSLLVIPHTTSPRLGAAKLNVRRPHPQLDLVAEVAPEPHLRVLHHDGMPVTTDTVVVPFGFRHRKTIQGAQELRSVALGCTVVSRAQRHSRKKVQQTILVEPLGQQNLRSAIGPRGRGSKGDQ